MGGGGGARVNHRCLRERGTNTNAIFVLLVVSRSNTFVTYIRH